MSDAPRLISLFSYLAVWTGLRGCCGYHLVYWKKKKSREKAVKLTSCMKIIVTMSRRKASIQLTWVVGCEENLSHEHSFYLLPLPENHHRNWKFVLCYSTSGHVTSRHGTYDVTTKSQTKSHHSSHLLGVLVTSTGMCSIAIKTFSSKNVQHFNILTS